MWVEAPPLPATEISVTSSPSLSDSQILCEMEDDKTLIKQYDMEDEKTLIKQQQEQQEELEDEEFRKEFECCICLSVSESISSISSILAIS